MFNYGLTLLEARLTGDDNSTNLISMSDQQLRAYTKLVVDQTLEVLNKRYMGDNNREDMEVLRCMEDINKYFNF